MVALPICLPRGPWLEAPTFELVAGNLKHALLSAFVYRFSRGTGKVKQIILVCVQTSGRRCQSRQDVETRRCMTDLSAQRPLARGPLFLEFWPEIQNAYFYQHFCTVFLFREPPEVKQNHISLCADFWQKVPEQTGCRNKTVHYRLVCPEALGSRHPFFLTFGRNPKHVLLSAFVYRFRKSPEVVKSIFLLVSHLTPPSSQIHHLPTQIIF